MHLVQYTDRERIRGCEPVPNETARQVKHILHSGLRHLPESLSEPSTFPPPHQHLSLVFIIFLKRHFSATQHSALPPIFLSPVLSNITSARSRTKALLYPTHILPPEHLPLRNQEFHGTRMIETNEIHCIVPPKIPRRRKDP